MLNVPPKSFGKLQRVEKSDFQSLIDVLIPLLPQSRRVLEPIKLQLIDSSYNNDYFYVPNDENMNSLSGIVVLLNGDYPDPTAAISFISKKEDASKAANIIEDSVNWETRNEFIDVPDWNATALLDLGQKIGQIEKSDLCPQFQKKEVPQIPNEQNSFSVKALGTEYANLINDNWKFRDSNSFHWIQSQCKNGLVFGTFSSSCDVKEPISWIMAYKYGAMGLLKTKKEWRGQGCAKACIKGLETKLLNLGIVPYVFINDYNQVSMKLFQKLGYEETHQSYWIVTLPKDTK